MNYLPKTYQLCIDRIRFIDVTLNSDHATVQQIREFTEAKAEWQELKKLIEQMNVADEKQRAHFHFSKSVELMSRAGKSIKPILDLLEDQQRGMERTETGAEIRKHYAEINQCLMECQVFKLAFLN